MKHVLVGLLAGMMAISGLSAQENSGNSRRWEQGKLTWDDFTKQENGTKTSASLYYFMTCNTAHLKINDTMVNHLVVETYIDRDSSTVNPKLANDRELLCQQVIFNLVELKSRELQQSVNRLRKQTEIDSCLRDGVSRLEREVEAFRTASGQGADNMVVRRWADSVQMLLDKTPNNMESIPAFKPTLFGFGADVGVGYHFITGDLGEKLKGGPNVQIGVNFALGRSELLLNACLGGSKVRRDSVYFSGEKWSATDHLEFCQLSASYGFRLLDRKHFQLTPFVGYGYNEISTIPGQDDEIKHKEKTGGFLGGVCLDYKLRTSLSLIPSYLKNKEMYTVSLRTKLYVTQTDFSDLPGGYIFNCALMVKVFDRFIRLD